MNNTGRYKYVYSFVKIHVIYIELISQEQCYNNKGNISAVFHRFYHMLLVKVKDTFRMKKQMWLRDNKKNLESLYIDQSLIFSLKY